MKPIIAVIGGSSCTKNEWALAHETGRLLADRGAIVVCGGLGGVMDAAAQGAKSNGGITVGILPGTDPAAANAYIDVPLATGLGEMRNLLIVRVAQALIAIGGGIGTLSEIALAQRTEKPVIGLHDSFRNAIEMPRATSAAEAVEWALERARSGVV
ncbi:MAG: TIGR00725 family protein [Gemmatimonadetes bacterium]|nr:MAG: TIGR00725 family protein [Gemmatimonadota bacterium]